MGPDSDTTTATPTGHDDAEPCGTVRAHGGDPGSDAGPLVIELSGEIDASLTAELDRVQELAARGGDPVVVRTAGVTFLDATGAAHLVTLHHRVCGEGRRLVLAEPSAATLWTLRQVAADHPILTAEGTTP